MGRPSTSTSLLVFRTHPEHILVIFQQVYVETGQFFCLKRLPLGFVAFALVTHLVLGLLNHTNGK